jgi:hypothetical protein
VVRCECGSGDSDAFTGTWWAMKQALGGEDHHVDTAVVHQT